MTTPSASPGRKGLDYAENVLGVNRVYDEALEFRKELDSILTDLAAMRDKRRETESMLNDREQMVAADEWGKHPDMAVTRMEKHLKSALSNDDETRELREQLAKVVSDIEGLEFDRQIKETDIKIAVSRLQELGGYLNYLAAIKQAAATEKPAKQRDEGDPWS